MHGVPMLKVQLFWFIGAILTGCSFWHHQWVTGEVEACWLDRCESLTAWPDQATAALSHSRSADQRQRKRITETAGHHLNGEKRNNLCTDCIQSLGYFSLSTSNTHKQSRSHLCATLNHFTQRWIRDARTRNSATEHVHCGSKKTRQLRRTITTTQFSRF